MLRFLCEFPCFAASSDASSSFKTLLLPKNTLPAPTANPTKLESPKLPFSQRQAKGEFSPPGFLFLRFFAKSAPVVSDLRPKGIDAYNCRWEVPSKTTINCLAFLRSQRFDLKSLKSPEIWGEKGKKSTFRKKILMPSRRKNRLTYWKTGNYKIFL